MFRGTAQLKRTALICFLGFMLILGGYSFAQSSDSSGALIFIPSVTSKTALEMHLLNDSPESAGSSLTFSWGNNLPFFTPVAQNTLPGGAAILDRPETNGPHQMTAKFAFTPSSELRVSFLYHQDQPVGQTPDTPASHLLFRYSMDYRVMPNLKVGLSGYLYRPQAEYFPWRGYQTSEPMLGFGPGVKYDLGRWSFLLRSQLEPGTKDRGEALHNWFRVWYSF